MDGKRLTPKVLKFPSSASKRQTPKNSATKPQQGRLTPRPSLNTTLLETSRMNQSCLDTTIGPNQKSGVIKKWEFDSEYNDYLQALLKHEIVSEGVTDKKQRMEEQLIIQKDSVFKRQMALIKVEGQVKDLDILYQVEQLLESLVYGFDVFSQLSNTFDLREPILEQLCQVLNFFCNKVSMRKIKVIKGEKEFNKLGLSLKKCIEICNSIKIAEGNMEMVNNLAQAIRCFEETYEGVNDKQNSLDTTQDDATFNLLKTLSDNYAKKYKE